MAVAVLAMMTPSVLRIIRVEIARAVKLSIAITRTAHSLFIGFHHLLENEVLRRLLKAFWRLVMNLYGTYGIFLHLVVSNPSDHRTA